jgi:CDGSH-type Zn-finger protein
MKSKKKKTGKYSKPEQDLDTKPKCGCGNTDNEEGFCDGSHRKKKVSTKESDIDKKIKAMLETGYYNHNQIAGMLRGVNLQKVKDVSRKITS